MSDAATGIDAVDHQPKKAPNRITSASNSLKFLIDPKNSPQPTHMRTRAFLRSTRYLAIFLFWRAVRYAKYAAIGAITAAVGATVFGSVVSGAAFVVAPTGILGGAGVGLLWAVGKFGWRRASARARREGKRADPRADEREDAGEDKPPVGRASDQMPNDLW